MFCVRLNKIQNADSANRRLLPPAPARPSPARGFFHCRFLFDETQPHTRCSAQPVAAHNADFAAAEEQFWNVDRETHEIIDVWLPHGVLREPTLGPCGWCPLTFRLLG